MSNFSLIIPIFNESENIFNLLKEIEELDFKSHKYEIIIVNDASTDNFISIFDSKKNSRLLKNINQSKYEYVNGSLNNKKKLETIFSINKFDYIINFAAETHVDQSNYFPEKFFKTNVLGFLNLLEIYNKKRKKSSKFIHVSTDEIFGSLKKNGKSFSETSQIQPNNNYSVSKASSDMLAFTYSKLHNLDLIVTNCCNNFGEFQHPEKLIPLTIIKCLLKEKIPIYGNGKNIREWIYVQDHCNAIYKLLKKGKSNERYLIGSGQEKSNIEVVKKICDYFNYLFKGNFNYNKLIKYTRDRLLHDFRYSINSKKFIKTVDKFNFTKFDKALIKTIEYYINNKDYFLKIYKNTKWFKHHYKT